MTHSAQGTTPSRIPTPARVWSLLAALMATVLMLASCTGGDAVDSTGEESQAGTQEPGGQEGSGEEAEESVEEQVAQPTVADVAEGTSLVPGSGGADLSAAAVETFHESSPMVVLMAEGDDLRGASAAISLGIPALVDGPDASAQIERLGVDVVLALGSVSQPAVDHVIAPIDDQSLAELVGAEVVTVTEQDAAAQLVALDAGNPAILVQEAAAESAPEPEASASPDPTGTGTPAEADSATPADPASPDSVAPEESGTPQDGATTGEPLESTLDEIPEITRAEPVDDVVVLTSGAPAEFAAVASARAAGATVVTAPGGDPRATSESVQAVASVAEGSVVALGDAFVDEETLAWRVQTAATGVELPGGGQLLFTDKTYVALYGTPSTSALGVLGEQGIEETITRAEEHAGWYESLTDTTIVPTLEIIATVASEFPQRDNSYSNELPMEDLRPLIDLAGENGQYVLLDLQPGRHDFLTQAQRYEELLKLPHVGLALDPEWRIGPNQVHLVQIGTVEIEEVNEVVHWLADLTRENDLPQKMLILHQFQTRMIPEADLVDQSRSEIAVLIHADGQGGQPAKQSTWRTLHNHAPSVEHWGWKNFYDEDLPMLTPEQTIADVDPVPDFISYQ